MRIVHFKILQKNFFRTYRNEFVSDCKSYSTERKKWKETVFSGIQPTGTLHYGNYFGAIQKWVELQDQKSDVYFSIVDMHSITLPQEPSDLHSSILRMAATLIACGIDPQKSIVFQQSRVPEHTQLSWVFGTLTTMVRLYHFPQYKEKSAALKDVPLGLFTYPVLQTADILLYKATHVPVGDDQLQHLHLSQHLVNTFNNRFGTVFPVPQAFSLGENLGGKIRSLREPVKKMSKSHTDPKSRLEILDPPETVLSKVKKAVTDFRSEVTYEPESRPGVSNLITLHSLASGKSVEEVCKEAVGLDTGKYKKVVAEVLIEKFTPLRTKLIDLLNSPEHLEDILLQGAEKAREVAQGTWAEVQEKVGFQSVEKFKKSRRYATE